MVTSSRGKRRLTDTSWPSPQAKPEGAFHSCRPVVVPSEDASAVNWVLSNWTIVPLGRYASSRPMSTVSVAESLKWILLTVQVPPPNSTVVSPSAPGSVLAGENP